MDIPTQPSQKMWIVRHMVSVTYVVMTGTRQDALNAAESGHIEPSKTLVMSRTCYQHRVKPPKYRKKNHESD